MYRKNWHCKIEKRERERALKLETGLRGGGQLCFHFSFRRSERFACPIFSRTTFLFLSHSLSLPLSH